MITSLTHKNISLKCSHHLPALLVLWPLLEHGSRGGYICMCVLEWEGKGHGSEWLEKYYPFCLKLQKTILRS